MSKRQYSNLGYPIYFGPEDLVVDKVILEKDGTKTKIKPHFVSVWNEETKQWNFRSKKTGKFYHYNDLLVKRGFFWEKNFEWVEKTSFYDVTPDFFQSWCRDVLYYNSFERHAEALKEYTGKPKGRDEYADLEREKWFLKFKEM